MHTLLALLPLLWHPSEVASTDTTAIHLPLYRRGGSFVNHNLAANTTYLAHILAEVEARYSRTYTDVEGNRLVRHWRDGRHGVDEYLLDGAGLAGSWYTIMQIGTPPQTIEVDIDMLSTNFYTIMTTSGTGSKYDTFASNSHESSSERVHPTCQESSDIVHLSSLQSTPQFSTNDPLDQLTTVPLRLPLPICQPPKYIHHTLFHSGLILGLSPATITTNTATKDPSSPLSRLETTPFLTTLLSTTTVTNSIIHITLLSPKTGLLTLGTPPTYHLEHTKITLEKQLSLLSSSSPIDPITLSQQVDGVMSFLVPEGSTHETHFTWSDAGASGIRGWHTGMASGIWVDGVKVLRNQMVMFDVGCPVILAPSGVGSVLYGAVSGGRAVGSVLRNRDESVDGDGVGDDERGKPRKQERFWAYPCLNVPIVEIEVGGWRFPITGLDSFNLGRVNINDDNDERDSETGYCIGTIVETNMAHQEKWGASAMENVWVLGEPFFRGVNVAFDFGGKGGRVGVRRN